MSSDDRFKQPVIATLAKRAANICSNPDCAALTSGPADAPARAVNVGEAAHIYGAHPGSARYDPAMASADRAAITNAIWLCGNCHKIVDDDPDRYPAGLLFTWQRDHERQVSERIGKAGAQLRQRYEARHLEEFGRLSYLAERLLLEKDDLWEYRLTSEVLRFEMAPVLRRWDALQRRLYLKPAKRLAVREFGDWLSERMSEAQNIAGAIDQLLNCEFQRAWGEPGIAGDETLVVSTCRLLAEVCLSALAWEEEVRFVNVHKDFIPVVEHLVGVMGGMIDEAAKLPKFMTDTFAGETPSGSYVLNLTLSLPEGWSEQTAEVLEQATSNIIAGIKSGEITY